MRKPRFTAFVWLAPHCSFHTPNVRFALKQAPWFCCLAIATGYIAPNQC